MRLLRVLGALLLLGGLVLILIVLSGAADTWLDEHWTCASGRGIPRERPCAWYEAKWSALVLSAGVSLAGLVIALIPTMRHGEPGPKALATIDLSFIRRGLRRRDR